MTFAVSVLAVCEEKGQVTHFAMLIEKAHSEHEARGFAMKEAANRFPQRRISIAVSPEKEEK